MVNGGAEEEVLYGSKSLMDLSAAQVRSFRSFVQQIPLTIFSCAWVDHVSSRLVRSQTLTTPSPLPLAKRSRDSGSFAMV